MTYKILLGTVLLTGFWWLVFGGVMLDTYSTLYQVLNSVFELITSGKGRMT